MDKWLPSIVSLIIALVGFGGSLLLVRGQRKKLQADSEGIMVNTARGLVTDLHKELDETKAEIVILKAALKINQAEVDFLRQELSQLKLKTDEEMEKLRKLIVTLRNGIKILTDQIRNLGHEPAWTDK